MLACETGPNGQMDLMQELVPAVLVCSEQITRCFYRYCEARKPDRRSKIAVFCPSTSVTNKLCSISLLHPGLGSGTVHFCRHLRVPLTHGYRERNHRPIARQHLRQVQEPLRNVFSNDPDRAACPAGHLHKLHGETPNRCGCTTLLHLVPACKQTGFEYAVVVPCNAMPCHVISCCATPSHVVPRPQAAATS